MFRGIDPSAIFMPRFFLSPDATEGAAPTEVVDEEVPPVAPVKPPKPNKGAKPPVTEPTDGRLTLTAEELEAEREKARKAVCDKIAATAARQKEEDDRIAAEEKGEWQEVATTEQKKREATEAENVSLKTSIKRIEVRESIRDYLRQHHVDYVGAEKWILPAVEFDLSTAPEDVTKRVKTAADSYVKDNPKANKGVPTPPPSQAVNRSLNDAGKPNGKQQFSGVSRGF